MGAIGCVQLNVLVQKKCSVVIKVPTQYFTEVFDNFDVEDQHQILESRIKIVPKKSSFVKKKNTSEYKGYIVKMCLACMFDLHH